MDEIAPIVIARTRELHDPPDYRRLKRRLHSGSWCRVAPGAYARASEWEALRPIQRHAVRVGEEALRVDAPVVFSHFAAAAIWGIDVLGEWPTRVEVRIPRATGGRSSGAIRRRALGIDGLELAEWRDHRVTSPAQTVVDLAHDLPFARAVSAIDQAIWRDRPGGALTTKDAVLDVLNGTPARSGSARARRAVQASEPLAANVRETQMRVLVQDLGFARPRLQERRVLASGRLVFGDLYFVEADHWVEIDGRGKYLSPQFGTGRDPAAIVIDEKNRENEIRREVRGFSRLEATDADHPRRVYDILTRDGLRSRLPRPRG
ncbi:hypothetical protein [Microbacterium paulum]|nr:hypothetical protein [Microbacterium sp.]